MKLASLLVTLGIILAIVYFTYSRTAAAPIAAPAPPSSLGEAPAADYARNAKSTADYTKRQVCLANCAAEMQVCTGISPDDPTKCGPAKDACEAACP